MRRTTRFRLLRTLVGLALIGPLTPPATAGWPLFRRRERVVVETVMTAPRPQDRVAPTGMLGSFTPTPVVSVRDNGVVGGGYTPLGSYGFGNSMSVFGPLSAFRQTAAPVNTVVRGYDGVPTLVQGTGFSNPNQPGLSPFVYPTRASNYSALKFQGTPPQRDKALMWIDPN
jgi:hypothetical protein